MVHTEAHIHLHIEAPSVAVAKEITHSAAAVVQMTATSTEP